MLRRLAPALKHDMVVNLQAVAMMAEVLNARLERGSPAPADFQASISKLNRLAREAVMNCLKVAAWIQPVEDEGIRLSKGVEECLALLASNFNFRGFTVEQGSARQRLPGVAGGLAPPAGGGADHLDRRRGRSLRGAGQGRSRVRVRRAVGASHARGRTCEGLPFEAGYRQLEWADVQALATAESVELVRGSDQIVMRMPRAIATAPLQIAPV